jgi:hypothetical protein
MQINGHENKLTFRLRKTKTNFKWEKNREKEIGLLFDLARNGVEDLEVEE